MKKYIVKCEVIFKIEEKKPMTETVQIIEKNTVMANSYAISTLMKKYPDAINVIPYQTNEVDHF